MAVGLKGRWVGFSKGIGRAVLHLTAAHIRHMRICATDPCNNNKPGER
jgi:hypothetical protein